MTRASDLARLIGAGGTVANDVTISEGSPSIKLNDTDTSRFIDILYGTRNATFRNTMASGEDMDTVAPETIFSTKDDGETREHFRMNKSEAVFNEGSVDLDFRVESDNDANAFFVEGETGNVAIGTNDPTVQDAGMRMLHIHNSATDGTGRSAIKLTNGDSTLAASRGAIINLDDAAQLTIGAFESSGKIVFATGGTTTRATIDSSGNVGIGKTNPSGKLHVNGASGSDQLTLGNTSESTEFRVRILEDDKCILMARDGDTARHLVFQTGITERMRIDSSGHFMIGRTSFSFDNTSGFSVAGSGSTIGQIHSITAGEECMKLNRKNSNGNGLAFFRGSTNNVGSINFGTSSVSYNTSSDYRLKENINYDFDATTRLKQLKPCRFNFIADPKTTVDGFIAHEVTAVPEAITGEKDAMTEEVLYVDGDEIPEGKKVGDVKIPSQINPQGIDQSKLVPLLVKTIQELEARIATLESK